MELPSERHGYSKVPNDGWRRRSCQCDRMTTHRTIEDSISATLEWLDEALRDDPSGVAQDAVAEERFADIAASQLLMLIPAELRRRSTWWGYGGTAVARRFLCEDWIRVRTFVLTVTALARARGEIPDDAEPTNR